MLGVIIRSQLVKYQSQSLQTFQPSYSESRLKLMIGVSLSPTPYKIKTLRAEHYLRCGADILLNGIQGEVEGEASCIICGATVRLKIRERKILELNPGSSLLHAVEIPLEHGKIGIECEGSPLFDKDDCLHTWLRSYTGRSGSVYKPQDFLDQMMRVRFPEKRS